MQLPRTIRIVPAKTAVLGCALIFGVVSTCLAETDGESAGEAALRADARKIFKENVEPFVKTYCTRCHGGGRFDRDVTSILPESSGEGMDAFREHGFSTGENDVPGRRPCVHLPDDGVLGHFEALRLP